MGERPKEMDIYAHVGDFAVMRQRSIGQTARWRSEGKNLVNKCRTICTTCASVTGVTREAGGTARRLGREFGETNVAAPAASW